MNKIMHLGLRTDQTMPKVPKKTKVWKVEARVSNGLSEVLDLLEEPLGMWEF